MTDTHRDKRLSDASSLQKSLASLHTVPVENRQEFFHDRIMSAIDDVCTRHKGSGTTGSFSNKQILVIKDIIFQDIFILEPMNKPKTGFINKLIAEWKDTSALKQVSLTVAAVGFILTSAAGVYHEGFAAVKFLKSISITQKSDEEAPTAASIPSKSATPAHSTPPP